MNPDKKKKTVFDGWIRSKNFPRLSEPMEDCSFNMVRSTNLVALSDKRTRQHTKKIRITVEEL